MKLWEPCNSRSHSIHPYHSVTLFCWWVASFSFSLLLMTLRLWAYELSGLYRFISADPELIIQVFSFSNLFLSNCASDISKLVKSSGNEGLHIKFFGTIRFCRCFAGAWTFGLKSRKSFAVAVQTCRPLAISQINEVSFFGSDLLLFS